ncbi:Glutathione S-transferase domain [Methylorubrum populi BJ001]|jgi:glutathione S-transferase|uniref:Glutathione S-transferase domain n=1 Tax=Methylorubrum populi (strain ATCC BAA-705 / NCIMB 13946 / BJ001) TaxID=441620 RepID=B1ZHM5_METPB|nr:glutathione S-transferase family protein [Methylorubrum populi]ACB81343.1 Glutathione S-transferase domain [Methylorubrum populi BJ001]OAH38104.1 glutathione S-transferase [Methylorubrum populi]PZP66986.1 MAG: glutathione S-transferase family protein [Methylorubrum populi]
MTLKLWGRASSGNVQKALWALDELGLAYEHIEAGGAHGIVGDASYRALNPNGLVPTLEEDGFVLWESNAILRYLAHAHGGPLALPEAPRARALIDQWLDWQATAFTPAMRDAFLQLVRVAPEKRDPRVVEASRVNSERCAGLLDRHLADTPFVAGETFSIADIAVGLAAHRWFQLPLEREERPNIRRWLEGLAQRPASSAVLSLPLT